MWSLLLVSTLTLAPPDFEVRLLGGDAVTGPIGQLDGARLTVQTADGPVQLETEDITGLSRPSSPRPPDPRSAVQVDLADGSRLVAAEYSVRDGLATIVGPRGRITEVPTRDVTAVRLGPQTDALAAEWARILESDLDADLLVIRKTESLDYHQGVLGDVSETVVRFELDGERLSVKRAKVHGLVYHRPADRSLPDPACSVTDADGSRWQVQSITLDGEEFRWSTPLGLEITSPCQEVVRIDFSKARSSISAIWNRNRSSGPPTSAPPNRCRRWPGCLPRARTAVWSRARSCWTGSPTRRAWPCTAAPAWFTACPDGSGGSRRRWGWTIAYVREATSAW